MRLFSMYNKKILEKDFGVPILIFIEIVFIFTVLRANTYPNLKKLKTQINFLNNLFIFLLLETPSNNLLK